MNALLRPETRPQPSRWVTIDTRERICVRSSRPRGEKGSFFFFSKNHYVSVTLRRRLMLFTLLLVRRCVYLLVYTLPPRNVSKLFAPRWKESRGREEGHRVEEATATSTTTTTTTRRRRREIVSWSCLCWSFLRGREGGVTRLYGRMAVYTFVTTSSKHREKYFLFLIFDSKWKREPFRGCFFSFPFSFSFFLREKFERDERGKLDRGSFFLGIF